jgi:hypothetical protein
MASAGNTATTAPPAPVDDAFCDLFELAIDVDAFASDWSYCDNLATYVARMVSHNRADPFQYANLFSSALNELLETAFRHHDRDGEIVCSVSRAGAVERIALAIPAKDAVSAFYRETLATAQRNDVAERYIEALLAGGPLDSRIGLLELAVDYRARFALRAEGDGSIRLIADLVLEQPSENSS